MGSATNFSYHNCCDTFGPVYVRLPLLEKRQSMFNEENLWVFFKGLGRMFYIVNPEETTFEHVDEVPQFFQNSWPYFLMFMMIENIILWTEKKPTLRINDSITSISHGIFQESGRLTFRGGESLVYVYLYENFRLIELPWNLKVTWYLAAIGVDFCYYWVHRACHEVHILWAQHQVHHSSEEFNLAVGLRQSTVQGWCGFLFYLPLAFFIPPSHFITHQQFNLLYQFWIHTKAVESLGPLEYVFNTPQHHRVHHGSNIYCLDKNYGGVLIIWDRIFGTFAKEMKDEEIIYGLVYNQPSFNPLHLQTFYTKYVIEKFRSMEGWRDKFAAIFYGPSWQPGRPRLGVEEDKVKVVAREKYDVSLPFWCNMYVCLHFAVVIYGFHVLAASYIDMTPLSVLFFVLYIIASLTSIGMICDGSRHASILEFCRCVILIVTIEKLDFSGVNRSFLNATEAFFAASSFLWFLNCANIVKVGTKDKLL